MNEVKEEDTRVVANSVKPLSLLIEADVHLVMARFSLVKALMITSTHSKLRGTFLTRALQMG